MVQLMLLGAMLLVPIQLRVAARVDEYAGKLGVADDMLRVARRMASGSLGLALIDFERSGYFEQMLAEPPEHLHTSRALDEAWEQAARSRMLLRAACCNCRRRRRPAPRGRARRPTIVVEIHGNVREAKCMQCGWRGPMDETLDAGARRRGGSRVPRVRRHAEVGDDLLRREPRARGPRAGAAGRRRAPTCSSRSARRSASTRRRRCPRSRSATAPGS